MTTRRALLYALCVTVVSGILLTTVSGTPTVKQAVTTMSSMFISAFFVMRFVLPLR